jgi:ribosome-associated translation inhibitor RaiA
MELNITAKNFHLNDTLEDYARKKMEKLKRFSHHMINGDLILDHDIYLGITEAFKKIERQLIKYEEKFRERKRIAQKTKRQ